MAQHGHFQIPGDLINNSQDKSNDRRLEKRRPMHDPEDHRTDQGSPPQGHGLVEHIIENAAKGDLLHDGRHDHHRQEEEDQGQRVRGAQQVFRQIAGFHHPVQEVRHESFQEQNIEDIHRQTEQKRRKGKGDVPWAPGRRRPPDACPVGIGEAHAPDEDQDAGIQAQG